MATDRMNGLERVATAMQFKEPDRVPAAPLVCGASHRMSGLTYSEWSQCTDIPAMVQGHVDALDYIGHDGVVLLVDLTVEAHAFGCEMKFPEMGTAHPNYDNPFIKSHKEYSKVKRIDPRKTQRTKGVIELAAGLSKEIGKTHAIVGFVYGSIGVLSMLRGPENFFMDLMEHPDEVMAAVQVVDEVLMDHPAVQQCVTFAMPHDMLGEEVAAIVVLREGASATEADLREFAARRLADFKVPRKILIRDEIPKGATGKLQRIGLASKLGLVP